MHYRSFVCAAYVDPARSACSASHSNPSSRNPSTSSPTRSTAKWSCSLNELRHLANSTRRRSGRTTPVHKRSLLMNTRKTARNGSRSITVQLMIIILILCNRRRKKRKHESRCVVSAFVVAMFSGVVQFKMRGAFYKQMIFS